MADTVNVPLDAAGLAPEPGPAPDALTQAVDFFNAGGPVMYVLLGCSIVGLAVLLLKLAQFALLRVGRRSFVEPALAAAADGRVREALDRLAPERSPLARVMEAAVRGLSARPDDDALVREEVGRVAAAELEGLRSHLRVLEIIGSLSPLLGLFGTVLGMITAFQRLQEAGRNVDPAVLSGGIWEAL
ncbi:MAG TPA: MotA/TolQ/ExbB proton channel family protein, partial [Alphaproteobacteria bacterium]|nr:MotA/TolQ/ExbB proton channel family protein [Alphaproteobacteria bacterium]